jgi:hypothetical protein
MKHAISIVLFTLLACFASPAMADTLITWYLNGNILTDNNTPVTGFFTWDATTETVTAFDISTQAGTGINTNGACCAPASVAVPAFEFFHTEFDGTNSTAVVFTSVASGFTVEFNSDATIVFPGQPLFSLDIIGTSESLLNGFGGATIGATITEVYTQPGIDILNFIFPVPYERTASFDPSGACASLASACLTTTPPSGVPEPGTLLLLGSGLAGLAAWGRKKMV